MILALGYPYLVADAMTAPNCPASEAKFVGITFGSLEPDERNWIRRAAGHLNARLARAAQSAGVHFEYVHQEFAGHELCTTDDPWINGLLNLRLEDWTPTADAESFHPTSDGQEAYMTVVDRSLDRFSVSYPRGFFESGMPRNP